jgi:hypothetical protein
MAVSRSDEGALNAVEGAVREGLFGHSNSDTIRFNQIQ